MELNINSPAYFSREYSIDNDVYRYCQKLHLFFKDKEYSDTLHTIGLMPVAAPQSLYDDGKWKESVQLVSNKSCAIIATRIDFNEYYYANTNEKIVLIKEMILKSVKKIRTRGKFNYLAFEHDLNAIEIPVIT